MVLVLVYLYLSNIATEKPCDDIVCANVVRMWNDTCVCEKDYTGAAGESRYCLYITLVVDTYVCERCRIQWLRGESTHCLYITVVVLL